MPEQIGGDVTASPSRRERISLVKQAADGYMSAGHAGVANMVKITKRVGIVERPVLAERLPVIASLNAMKHHESADVGAGEELAVAVEVEAPHVAAAFAEELEPFARRVIAPDALLKLDTPDLWQ